VPSRRSCRDSKKSAQFGHFKVQSCTERWVWRWEGRGEEGEEGEGRGGRRGAGEEVTSRAVLNDGYGGAGREEGGGGREEGGEDEEKRQT
jgi:hypothetical protein